MNSRVIVRVSITDQLDRDPMARRDVPLPKDTPSDIVRIPSNGSESVPAIIGFQTVLEVRRLSRGGDILHQWHVTASPDNGHVRGRFVAPTEIVIDDGQPEGRSASYNMISALNDAHRQLSELMSPDPLDGTTVRMWFGFKRGGEEFSLMSASSLAGLEREANRIKAENATRRLKARVHFPWTKWVIWEGKCLNEPIPEIPRHDEWKTFHHEALGILLKRSFMPCLTSLWKAAFATGMSSDQLRAHDLPPERIGQTFVSDNDLRRAIAAQNKPNNRTAFFDPDEHDLPEEK